MQNVVITFWWFHSILKLSIEFKNAILIRGKMAILLDASFHATLLTLRRFSRKWNVLILFTSSMKYSSRKCKIFLCNAISLIRKFQEIRFHKLSTYFITKKPNWLNFYGCWTLAVCLQSIWLCTHSIFSQHFVFEKGKCVAQGKLFQL